MATAPWRTVCILYSVAAALAGCGERPPKVIGKAVGFQTSAPSGDATCPRTRSNPGQCTDTRLVRPAEGPTVEEEGIHYDSDCDSADGIGMLVPAASGVAASCAPACLHDADCPPNSACECTGRAGTCVFAQCLTNANCHRSGHVSSRRPVPRWHPLRVHLRWLSMQIWRVQSPLTAPSLTCAVVGWQS